MLNILVVVGTRPEMIKMAPVILELKKYPDVIGTTVCLTGQHKEMLEPLLELFNITPDHNLSIMEENQSLEHIASSVLHKLKDLFQKKKFDMLLVQGDTTTSMAASLGAYYNKVKVVHIESGLRTRNIYEPYPEEINRRIIDNISHFCFAPTETARANLLQEGKNEENISVTGNTVIDALLKVNEKEYKIEGSLIEGIPFKTKTIVLVTAHRRENFGEPLNNICSAIKELANRHKDVHFVYPVHLNPNVKGCVYSMLSNIENVSLLPPLDYHSFVYLMRYSFIILSDSGGIQEEASSLHVPVLVLRDTTERPEALEVNATKLVGTDPENIIKETTELLESIKAYRAMANSPNPYGDGTAAEKIVKRLLQEA